MLEGVRVKYSLGQEQRWQIAYLEHAKQHPNRKKNKDREKVLMKSVAIKHEH